MVSIRSVLGLGPKSDEGNTQPESAVAETGSPKWTVTLTGPLKGIPPVSITVAAPTGKAACAGLKALFLHGKLKVERA